MTEKEKILNIIYKHLIESGEIISDINDFDKFENTLSSAIKENWNSQNDFFNELAEFGFGDVSKSQNFTNDQDS